MDQIEITQEQVMNDLLNMNRSIKSTLDKRRAKWQTIKVLEKGQYFGGYEILAKLRSREQRAICSSQVLELFVLEKHEF